MYRIGDTVMLLDGSDDLGVVEFWDGGWFVRLTDGELFGPWNDDELEKVMAG